MFNACSIEALKTKRTVIRKLVWIFPILVTVVTALFFASTGYVVQSIINQWSFIWINLFLALIIGLNDRHEKNSTEYKMILSSPVDLFQYELGRILHGVLLSFVTSLVLCVLVAIASFFMPVTVSLLACLGAILGIFVASLWEIPLYSWLSRVTNLYVSIAISFVGSLVAIWVNTYTIGKIFPYTWSALMPVQLIKMHVNGLLIKSSEGTPNNDWTMVASIILFLVLSYLSAYFFKKQVIKNA
ncbi:MULTISPECIES: lantibiotic immunity ABC transporter MutE/EpiE family permease subunit [Lactobacillaceae]|uniref:lantibiotic immunity ABC transporter MutE/EpiE family permease subunit n=1 Tax=Lactobacillaceae TaxID=33958 RepID=UPI0024B9CEB5|nr:MULTISPECIES: lantibiotic immunity ABC transporter MutE/EpiE family permease subunit [Lactobacillaceae]